MIALNQNPVNAGLLVEYQGHLCLCFLETVLRDGNNFTRPKGVSQVKGYPHLCPKPRIFLKYFKTLKNVSKQGKISIFSLIESVNRYGLLTKNIYYTGQESFDILITVKVKGNI